MYEGFSVWAFLMGLPLGMAITGIVMYFQLKKAKKERRLDERFVKIRLEARSISWMTTSFAILILWSIVLFIEKPGLAFWVLTTLWIVHMGAYVIGNAIASKRN